MIMNKQKVMLTIPGERPFTLYDNRLFLSVAENGASDFIAKGDLNMLASSLVIIMMENATIAELMVKTVRGYEHFKKEGL
jgi:hypothetical protein